MRQRELIECEREAATRSGSPRRVVDDACLADLMALSSSLDSLLDAPTTAPRDRKELMRILIERVVVEERTKERIVLRIVWRNGVPDELHTVLLWGYAHRIAAEMDLQGATAHEIAERLRKEKVTTKARTDWTPGAVRRQLARARRQPRVSTTFPL